PRERARRQAELLDRGLEEALGARVERAVPVDLAAVHVGVAADAGAREARCLTRARGVDAGADRGGRLAGRGAGEVDVGEGGYLDVQVEAVEERSGDALPVARRHAGWARACVRRVAEVAARASPRCQDAIACSSA